MVTSKKRCGVCDGLPGEQARRTIHQISIWRGPVRANTWGRPMGVLTLVRHAQASFFADDYDELSPLGREQARLLGEFWVRRRIDFDEVYCGPRARQRQTADVVGSVFTRAGRDWPEPVVLAELDEYDLGGLLATLAP